MAVRSLEEILGQRQGGKWTINDRHEIEYWARGNRAVAALKATLLDVRPAALVLEYTQKDDADAAVTTRLYELHGTWRVDPQNRLAFVVQKETGRSDVLTFRNIWTVNANHEIEYSIRQTAPASRVKTSKKLILRGFWDISERSRITYWLGGDSDTALRFRGAFQSRSILAKKGEIRYQIGVEADKKIKTQTLTLFGVWKYSRKLGLRFEMEYGEGRKRAVVFGSELHPAPNDTIELNLKTREGQKLGVELVLSRDFSKLDGGMFLRALKDAQESRIEAGLSFKW